MSSVLSTRHSRGDGREKRKTAKDATSAIRGLRLLRLLNKSPFVFLALLAVQPRDDLTSPSHEGGRH